MIFIRLFAATLYSVSASPLLIPCFNDQTCQYYAKDLTCSAGYCKGNSALNPTTTTSNFPTGSLSIPCFNDQTCQYYAKDLTCSAGYCKGNSALNPTIITSNFPTGSLSIPCFNDQTCQYYASDSICSRGYCSRPTKTTLSSKIYPTESRKSSIWCPNDLYCQYYARNSTCSGNYCTGTFTCARKADCESNICDYSSGTCLASSYLSCVNQTCPSDFTCTTSKECLRDDPIRWLEWTQTIIILGVPLFFLVFILCAAYKIVKSIIAGNKREMQMRTQYFQNFTNQQAFTQSNERVTTQCTQNYGSENPLTQDGAR